jgi:hypothetical protein
VGEFVRALKSIEIWKRTTFSLNIWFLCFIFYFLLALGIQSICSDYSRGCTGPRQYVITLKSIEILRRLLFNLVLKTVSLHYYLAECLHFYSKRTSGFDMAPSNAAGLSGASVPGLQLNSFRTYTNY